MFDFYSVDVDINIVIYRKDFQKQKKSAMVLKISS